jgi:peptide/nickel transport system substrate-binding protein
MSIARAMDRRAFLRSTGIAAALAGSGSLVAACAGQPSSAGLAQGTKIARGGTLTLATADTPIDLDPQDEANYASLQVYGNIFARLVSMDTNYNIHPSLAHSWAQEDDVTWTMDLVDNAVFHNGDPLTAEDVQFSFDRVRSHNNSVYLSAFKSTEILSKYKVRFHLTGPLGPFLPTLSEFSDIVSKRAVTAQDPKLHPVGAGPFKFVEWVQNDHITLERWDKYFDKDLPYLDKLVFRAIADDSVRLTDLQSGQVDWIQQVAGQEVPSLSRNSSVSRSPARPYLPDMIALNVTKPPFNDVRVRQAIAWSIDRAEIARLVFFSEGSALTEGAPAGSPFHSGIDPYAGAPDPEKAKALLKAAGVEGLQVTYDGQTDLPTQITIGEILKSQLAKAGIDLKITNYTAADWISRLLGKQYEMTETYFALDIDPAWIYYPLCLSTSKQNFTGFGTPEGDALLKPLMFNTSESARIAAYAQVVRYIAEQAPIIFLLSELQQYWMKPQVSGPLPAPTLELDCSAVSKA